MTKLKNMKFLTADSTYDKMDSPVGVLTIVANPNGLQAVLWEVDRKNPDYIEMANIIPQSTLEKTVVQTKKQLTEYFQGKRKIFDLPLVMHGTPFQIAVWKQLQKIPYSTTISYGEQAKRLGDKNKARAVGLANGLNPISIIVPCHRVIGSNGHLVGFGGGLDNKAYLLQLEKTYS